MKVQEAYLVQILGETTTQVFYQAHLATVQYPDTAKQNAKPLRCLVLTTKTKSSFVPWELSAQLAIGAKHA